MRLLRRIVCAVLAVFFLMFPGSAQSQKRKSKEMKRKKPSVTQTMTNSPGGIQAARDVIIQSPASRPELRAYLIPARDPNPEHRCGDILSNPALKGLFFGGSVHAFLEDRDHFSIVTIANEDLLTFNNTTSGLVLNCIVRDADYHIVATIKNNVFHSYAGDRYEAKNPDQHSVLVLGPSDEIILYVRYLNPRAIKVLGTFRAPNRPPVTFEEGRIVVGNTQIDTLCSIDSAPIGSWMVMKAAFMIS